jgi:O-antigen/teichoic acid export membrane protein
MSYSKSRDWVTKITMSLVEQGLYSLPNFILNILLARWLSEAEYGSFAFGFTIFLLLSGFHTALINEPMMVLGTAKYRKNMFSYLESMLIFHVVLTSGLISLGLLSRLIIYGYSPLLAEGLLGASISTPFILLHWLFRRACYMYGDPQIAVKGSSLYALSILGIFILRQFELVNVLNAFLLMSVGSILASILMWYTLRGKYGGQSIGYPHREILIDHWVYGKWVLGSAVASWISTSISIPALGLLYGPEHAGIFRAMQNLALPLQQIYAVLDSLLVPWLSSQTATASSSDFINKSKNIVYLYLFTGVFYLVILYFTKDILIAFLYGDQRYQIYSWLVISLGMYALMDMIFHSFSVTLRALQKPNAVFWAQLASAIISLTINFFLIWKLGLEGASYGILLTGAVMLGVLLIHYLKHLHILIDHKRTHQNPLV